MKKIFSLIILVLLFLVACSELQEPSADLANNSVRLSEFEGTYKIEDFTSFGIWCLYFDKNSLNHNIKGSKNSYFKINNRVLRIEKNSVDHNILMVYIPGHYSLKEIENSFLTTEKTSEFLCRSNGKITLNEVIIERNVVENNTNLYELQLNDYVSMKITEDDFIYQNGTLIRPSYVKSSEENAYALRRYYNARQASSDHDTNGAFVFLKEQSNHEDDLLSWDNPNRVTVENEIITVEKPDSRDRLRRLGEMGPLSDSSTYTYDIHDKPSVSQIIVSFKRDNLPNERYRKSIAFEIQINEATICTFTEADDEVFNAIVQYATTDNTELLKNARFSATPPSTSTDLRLINGDGKLIRLITDSSTSLKMASGTTAEEMLAEITSVDGRKQKYHLYDDSGILTSTTIITGDATLVVESEWGADYTAEYPVSPIETYFVRLENSDTVSWHDSIQSAVDDATNGSTVTVYEGNYKESVVLSSTTTHLMTENPMDVQVRDKTIINSSGKNAAAVVISGMGNHSVVEGFSITTDLSNGYPGIYLDNVSAEICHNRIFENINNDGGGIYVKSSNTVSERSDVLPTIHHNIVENNSAQKGGGVYLGTGLDVKVYENVIRDNDASEKGGGIYVSKGTAVKNKENVMWTAHLLPGTVEDIREIENTDVTNMFTENTINSDVNTESAVVYYSRTPAPSAAEVVVHYSGKWLRVYGNLMNGDIARLYTNSSDKVEVASSTYSAPMSTRLPERYIEIPWEIQENTEYFASLQSFDINRQEQSLKVATVSIDTPATPTLLSPIDEAYFVSYPVTLSWNTAEGAVSYNLFVGTSTDSLGLFASEINDTQYATNALEELQAYYWQVESVDRYGMKRKSEMIWSFITCSTAFNGGDGTINNPLQVHTAAQLNAIRDNCLGDSDRKYYFKQTADIDLSGISSWDPIGGVFPDGSSERFYSHYDGAGFKISNMMVNKISEFHGGFISILYGSVKNVRLLNCDVTAKAQNGLLVGTNEGLIENCAASGTVTGTAQYTGGFVGVNGGTIKSSFFQGTVSGGLHTGGFSGLNQGNIENSYTKASATSEDNFAGGFVAYTDRGTILNCYSTGKVLADASSGGFCGYNVGGTISNSFWDKETSRVVTSDGGTGKTTDEMKLNSTFTEASWDLSSDLDTIWNRGSGTNDGYPYLRNNAPF